MFAPFVIVIMALLIGPLIKQYIAVYQYEHNPISRLDSLLNSNVNGTRLCVESHHHGIGDEIVTELHVVQFDAGKKHVVALFCFSNKPISADMYNHISHEWIALRVKYCYLIFGRHPHTVESYSLFDGMYHFNCEYNREGNVDVPAIPGFSFSLQSLQ